MIEIGDKVKVKQTYHRSAALIGKEGAVTNTLVMKSGLIWIVIDFPNGDSHWVKDFYLEVTKKGDRKMAKKAATKSSSKKATTGGKKVTTKKASTKKAVTTKKVTTKKNDGLTQQQRWDARWKFLTDADNYIVKITNHHSLPDGKKLMRAETIGGWEVRLYKDDTYTSHKVLFTSLKGSETFKFFSQYKEDNYDLPMVGRQLQYGKIIDRLSKEPAAKKATAKKVVKKAAKPTKKPAAKKTVKKAAKAKK
jgi:hypothetical protein